MDAERLITWYRANARPLPWRHPASPWAVLVSEAMLQQTQVATVLPYFDRFMRQFPSAAALAAAPEQQVLKAWEGLGYYRRARNLQAAARVLVDQHGGEVPDDAAAVRALPGVGRYTAGAVMSSAFNRREPIVDGNVARVLARHGGIDEPVDGTAGQKRLWAEATALVVRASSPRDVNQALMELGATLCTPKSPRCMFCPVREGCVAEQTGRQADLPRKKPKRPPTAVTHRVFAIERRGRWLMRQRPAHGLWAGLWEFITLEEDSEDPEAVTGLSLTGLNTVGSFVHQTTHRTVTFDVARAGATGRMRPGVASWHTRTAAAALPLAKPQQRVLGLL